MEQRNLRNMVDSASRFVSDVQWQIAYRKLQMAPADSETVPSAQKLLNTFIFCKEKDGLVDNMIIWRARMSSMGS